MMQREEFDRLLAGYATKQISEEEAARLMEAAMMDQTLFNALADEDALRETLADPQLKAELLSALSPLKKQSFWSWSRKPQIWALAGTAAVAALAFVIMIRPQAGKQKQAEIAQARAPAPASQIADDKPQEIAAPAKAAPKSAAVTRQRIEETEMTAADKRLEPQLAAPAQLSKDAEKQKEAKQEEVMVTAVPQSVPTAPRSAAGFRATDEAASITARAKASTAVQPSLQYTVLRKNDQGEFVESAPGTILGKGDSIRLAVTSTSRGYISLTEPGLNRQIYFGFAEAGLRYVIPASGEVTLDAAGTEKRMRLSLVIGAGNAAIQSLIEQASPGNQAATGNLSNSAQNTGPISQSTIEVIVRYR